MDAKGSKPDPQDSADKGADALLGVTSCSTHEDCEQATDAQMKEKTLSKNQLKKLKKKQRWIEIKADKRQKDRARKKLVRSRKLQNGEDLGPSRKALKKNQMKDSRCRIRVAVDLSFDDLMGDKDVCKLVQQIQHCYSANRRATDPLQFYLTSLGGKTQGRMESIGHLAGWDIYQKHEDYTKAFDKSSVVYLSSDSPNMLHTLADDKVYIIGGLVDHNHHKGLCHKLALEKDIEHAQLPIATYLDMKTRKVLTINHVFEILLHFTETHSWEESFYRVIPKRKGAGLKSAVGAASAASEDGADADTDGRAAAEAGRRRNEGDSEERTCEHNSDVSCSKSDTDSDGASDLTADGAADNNKAPQS